MCGKASPTEVFLSSTEALPRFEPRSLLLILGQHHGKAEPFRTSSSRAAEHGHCKAIAGDCAWNYSRPRHSTNFSIPSSIWSPDHTHAAGALCKDIRRRLGHVPEGCSSLPIHFRAPIERFLKQQNRFPQFRRSATLKKVNHFIVAPDCNPSPRALPRDVLNIVELVAARRAVAKHRYGPALAT